LQNVSTVLLYCTSFNLKLSRLVDFLASILEYGVESVLPSCFADNADHDSIYCKLKETDPFILPSLNESGQIVWNSSSLDNYRRDETEKADFKEIADEFASIKTRKVLFLLDCHRAYTRKGWIYW